VYVSARHHKMCKLVDWSHPNNITFCSRAPGHATEEQAKQPNMHMLRKSTLYIRPMWQITMKSVLRVTLWFAHSIMAIQGITGCIPTWKTGKSQGISKVREKSGNFKGQGKTGKSQGIL
jgi:hypothetical protein